MELSVIIVSYKVKYYLEQCIVSLKRALKDIEAEIIVVDNHSNDGTVEYLSARYPDINIISSNHNYGFAKANNIAIKQSKGRFVLLLNPDTIVGEHTMTDVLTFMKSREQIGSVGVRMLRNDGSDAMESRRGIPTPMTAFYKMSGLCARFPKNKRFGHYYMGYLPWDEASKIEIVSGAFCMIRRNALEEIGLLDEDFFMYGEDIDLSFRLLKSGYENWYYPSRILHYKGESTRKTSFRYVHVFYGSMLIFFRKHYAGSAMLISVPVKCAIYAKALFELIKLGLYQVRKGLGFFDISHNQTPLYVFIGEHDAIANCRKLAVKKGLNAIFHEGNSETRPSGHTTLELPNDTTTYVVYDVNAYSFEKILSIFSNNTKANVHIGTYNSTTQTIITSDEIFR